MKINSNIQALIANSVLKANEEKYSTSTEKMSSGYKINHAKDSPAGMAISNRMNAQIRSLNKASDNASNAINVVQTADGALTEVHNMLQRMSELAVKGANGTMTELDREAIQEEVNALKKEINRIASDTEYNTQNLLGGEQAMKGYTDDTKMKVMDYSVDFPKGDYSVDVTVDPPTLTKADGTSVSNLKDVVPEDTLDGRKIVTATLRDGSTLKLSYDPANPPTSQVLVDVTGMGGMKIQVGSSTGQEIQMVIPKMDTISIGIDAIDMRTEEGSQKALSVISNAIDYVSKSRSSLGAYQNRLESTVASLEETIEELTASYATIKDVDMAEEMVEYTKLQVLVQAGTSMLTQANEQPQQALQLLQ